MSTVLAPDDVVRTHEAAAGQDREPLLVLEPLLAFLADHGLDALKKDKHLAKGLNVLAGELTHPAVAQALGKSFIDPYGAWG